jgi:Flp pilus assembly protein TadG
MYSFHFFLKSRLFGRLLTQQEGAVLPIFAMMVIIMVVIAGAAFDVSRAVNAREKLSYALDAAALSVAADLSTSLMTDAQIKKALGESFKANLTGAEFLDQAIENIVFKVDAEKGIVTVSSKASLNNYFIDLGGYMQKHLGPDAFEFGTSSQVSYSKFEVELALVVDVTGSMSSTDMKTLRDASTAVVNILLPENIPESDAKVRISLIPYSQGVNLGTYAKKARGGDFYSVSGTCVTERQDYLTNKVMLTDEPYNYFKKSSPPPVQTFFGGGSTSCSSTSKLVPLTKKRNILLPAIAALSNTGGTAGQTGTAWGWYTLSPNYANLWPSESAPAAYTNKDTLKFAIIMTDGDNNRYYQYVEQEEQCGYVKKNGKQVWECNTVTVNAWRETSETESFSNKSSTRSRDLCAAMKSAGIQVFGVYFGTNNASAGAKNMQSCSNAGNYYQASSSSELIGAFSNIARKIQSIYLSK